MLNSDNCIYLLFLASNLQTWIVLMTLNTLWEAHYWEASCYFRHISYTHYPQQATQPIVSHFLTCPEIMTCQYWTSHGLTAIQGNQLYRATVSAAGHKCLIPGSLGQAHKMHLPPGMEDLEPLFVTSGLHADVSLPLLNTPYTQRANLCRIQHLTEHLPVVWALGQHREQLEWTAPGWREGKQPVFSLRSEWLK